MSGKKKIVVSDAAPLIQLSIVHSLELLPRLYDVNIPKGVFQETQHYPELPDAIQIAKATGKWLVVRAVRNRKEENRLMGQKLGEGEAEAIVLCKEIGANALLPSDMYAALQARSFGLTTFTIGDAVREAYDKKTINATEAVALLETLVDQNVLNTGSVRRLLREAKKWL